MPQPPKFSYPAGNAPLVNEGQAIANAANALQSLFVAAGTPLGEMSPVATAAAAAAEALSAMLVAAPAPSVTVTLGTVAASTRVTVNVDFVPPLLGPGFDAFVQVNDQTNTAGTAGLRFERIVSISAQFAAVQVINDSTSPSTGSVTVTGVSFTPSLGGNPATDPAVAALRAAVAGNIQLFDKRYNQITSGGLSRWDPVLGLCPPIVGRASHFPVTLGNGFPITTDGVAQAASMTTLSTIFDQSLPFTLIGVARSIKQNSGVAATTVGVASAANASNTILVPGNPLIGAQSIFVEPGGNSFSFIGPAVKSLDGLIGSMVMMRTGTTLTYAVPPGPIGANQAVTVGVSAAAGISLGADITFSQFAQTEIHAIGYFDHVASTAELQAWYTYQLAAHPDQSLTDFSIHDGDSQTYGNGLGDLTGNYPTQLIQLPVLSRQLAAVNTGIAGKQLLGAGGLLATYPTFIAPMFRAGRRNQYLVLWTGTNDFVAGATVAATLSGVQSYIVQALATGFSPKQMVLMTVLSRGDTNIDALRDVYNPQAVALAAAFGINCAPIHLDPIMGIDGAWSNGTFFNADHVHPTAAGYTRIVQNFLQPIFRATMN